MSFKQGTFTIPPNAVNPVTVPFNYNFGTAPELVLVSITSTLANPAAITAVVGTIVATDFEVTLSTPPVVTGYSINWIAGSQAEVVNALSVSRKPVKLTYLTVEEMRMFLLDNSAEDNSLDMDLSFSDDEIAYSMRRAAREYNSTPPFVGRVDPNSLPIDTNLFLHATAEQLYISELARSKRNDMDYTAGGVTVNIEAKRIKHFEGLVAYHREQWKDTATKIKVSANLAKAYRKF